MELNQPFVPSGSFKESLDRHRKRQTRQRFSKKYGSKSKREFKQMLLEEFSTTNSSDWDKMKKKFEDTVFTSSNLAEKIVDAVADFMDSTTISKSIISRKGQFSQFEQSTDAFVLPGVLAENASTAIDTMVANTLPDAPPTIAANMKLTLLSTRNTSDWHHQVIHFNASTGGHANSLIFRHVWDTDGKVDLAYCAITANFQVLGDLMITTKTKEYLGGLITGSSSQTITAMPPHWTQNDTLALDNIFNPSDVTKKPSLRKPAVVCHLPDGDDWCAEWCYRVLHKNGGTCEDGTCVCDANASVKR